MPLVSQVAHLLVQPPQVRGVEGDAGDRVLELAGGVDVVHEAEGVEPDDLAVGPHELEYPLLGGQGLHEDGVLSVVGDEGQAPGYTLARPPLPENGAPDPPLDPHGALIGVDGALELALGE
eukprot:6027041-Prorocentrum_lima.AAC.1